MTQSEETAALARDIFVPGFMVIQLAPLAVCVASVLLLLRQSGRKTAVDR